jgi:hypothetical protein
MNHKQAAEALPLYASGQLEMPERKLVEAHLEVCSECRMDLALWVAVSRVTKAANRDVAAPGGLAERALALAAGEPSFRGAALRVWTLVRAQAPLVRRELFPASAALMILAVFVAVLAGRVAAFSFLAPLIASASLAVASGRQQDAAAELVLSAPTAAWKVLLARWALVSAYNLMLALAASVAISAVMPTAFLGPVIQGWLGPLTFLSALALVLAMWAGAGTALLVSYTLWMLRWVSPGSVAGPGAESWSLRMSWNQGFWHNTPLLLVLGAVLTVAALWSAERTARPGTRPEVL